MALLEMGANVETNGYPSRFYSPRNFIFGTEGNTWTSSNGKGKLINDCHHHFSLSVPSPTHILGYDKELLKKTILKHEAMFKDQIHELHRLYQKQRELMNELRRNELYKHNNLSIEISWSGALPHVSSENAPKECCCSPKLALAAGESSVLVAENTLLPLGSVQEKIRPLCPDPSPGISLVEGLLKDSKPSNCNYKKVGKKILDLELPADEYIDCEGDSGEDERVSRVAEVSTYTSNGNIFSQSEALKKKQEHVNDLLGFRSSDQINLGLQSKEKNSVSETSVGTQGPTSDGLLLGPSSGQLVSEGVEDPKNTNLSVTPAVCSETMAFQSIWVNDQQSKLQDSGQALPWLLEKPVVPKRQLNGEDCKISTQHEPVILKHYLGGIHGFEIKKVGGIDLYKDKILVIPVNGKPHTRFDLHSSHVSPSNICQIQSDNQKIEETGRDCVHSVNSSCNLPDLGQMPEGDKKNENEKKRNCLTGIIDLNSCLNEDVDTPVDFHFQAPEGLQQNGECSPGRGEFDENQLEMPYRLAGQEDPLVEEHEGRIAAEALVSMSAFVVPSDPQMTDCSPSESFMDSPLHWFAKTVSSIKDHPDNEVKVDCSVKTGDDLEEFLPAGIDYFEAMTLPLTETQNLDCCCNKIKGSYSLSQPRKGQATKRGRRQRDFQSEILPSVAALSRSEVTADLQIIEGLMEVAGTHLEKVSPRSAGRGRKRSRTLASKVSDSLLKHLTDDTDLRIEKRGLLVSWEKTSKKRRGQRYPTSNPQFFSRTYI